jgi:hypothetical protein
LCRMPVDATECEVIAGRGQLCHVCLKVIRQTTSPEGVHE